MEPLAVTAWPQYYANSLNYSSFKTIGAIQSADI